MYVTLRALIFSLWGEVHRYCYITLNNKCNLKVFPFRFAFAQLFHSQNVRVYLQFVQYANICATVLLLSAS